MERGVLVALAAMAAAVFVIANDVTALSVALPDIEREFDADVSTVQWVINAYALVFGVLIVPGGRLADLFGRRRIFFVGSAIFVAFSLLGALAPSAVWLIACRALMGIGGAMMWPAMLGMTYAALPAAKAGLAGGLIIGAAGFGNAAGPLIGGAITDSFGWQWVLVLNLPVAGLACLATWYAIHQPTVESADRRVDYAGVATLTGALVALLLALDQVTDWGLDDPRVIALFVLFVVLLTAFVVIERRGGPGALIPSDVMRNKDFRYVCLAVLLMSATFFAALLYLPQFMQKVLDYDPLEAGAGLLPMMGTFAVVSFAAGPLYERLGPKVVVSAGAVCLAVGPFLISLIDSSSDYVSLVPGMVVLGLGVGLFYSSVTTAGVTALDPSRTSLAGGIVYMFQVAGGSVGLGLTTAIFTTASNDKLQGEVGDLDAVRGVLAGTESARRAPEAVIDLVRDAFAAGMQWSFRVVALLALGGLVISVLFVGGSLISRRVATAEG
jgi:EmrB/QacA subfamily drug resistance transporter